MFEDVTQHIGVLSVSLHFPAPQSLKEKRVILRGLRDRIRAKFNVSIAELDGHNKWQVALAGFVMIGNDTAYIDSCLQNILSHIEQCGNIQLCDHRMEFR